MSLHVLFLPEIKISLSKERGSRLLVCAAALTRHPDIWKYHSAIKQIHPLAHARPTTRVLHCQSTPASSASYLDLLCTHPYTSIYRILSGNQGRNIEALGFTTGVPSDLVQMDQDISGNSNMGIHLPAAVFQNLLSGEDISCKQTRTDTYRHTLPIAQAELCATLSIWFVYFSGTMYKHFQQNSLHLSLFTR